MYLILSTFQEKGCEDAKKVVDALRSKGAVKVGAAGFCWGGTIIFEFIALDKTSIPITYSGVFVVGMAVVRLAKYDCIDAAVLLHPGPITQEQITGD